MRHESITIGLSTTKSVKMIQSYFVQRIDFRQLSLYELCRLVFVQKLGSLQRNIISYHFLLAAIALSM